MNVAVDFKNVDIVFGPDTPRCACHGRQGRHARRDPGKDRQRARLRRRQPDRQRGRDFSPDGAVRLRQVDAAAGRQPPEHRQPRPGAGARRRQDGRRRLLRRGDAAAAAPEERRHGVPAVRPAAVAHGRGKCRPRPRARRHAGGRAQGARRPSAEAGQSRPVGARNTRTSCRAACSSASAWPAPSPPKRRSC